MAATAVPPAKGGDQFITAKDAAKILKVSVFTIYDWTKNPHRSKGMPFKRFGRVIRIPQGKFNAWIEGPN